MSETWVGGLRQAVAQHGVAVRVSVTAAEGSTPREAGAAMLVTPGGIVDTIGGGALEHEAIAAALRFMTAEPAPWRREVLSFPLGPSLGQCCGGHVRLLLEAFTAHEIAALPADAEAPGVAALLLRPTVAGVAVAIAAHRKAEGTWPAAVRRLVHAMLSGQTRTGPILLRGRRGAADWYIEPLGQPSVPLYLYGAGHVGRALVRTLERLPFAVSWIDTAPERFPPLPPAAVRSIAARDPAAVAGEAPADAYHLVMTYSHPLDLAICHAVLKRGAFAYLGLIGSATKRARFARRLAGLGIAPAALARLNCPIGIEGLAGKAPDVIAVSVAADLLRRASLAAAEAQADSIRNATTATIGGAGERDRVDLG